MSSADTWMPLYVGDYLADTGHLSACEHGAYLLLLMHYWRNGPLPDNDKQLAAIARTDRAVWETEVGPVVREFFVLIDGRLHQKRADAERSKAREVSEKRRNAAKNRWQNGSQSPPPRPNGNHPPDANPDANALPKAPALGGANGHASHSQMHTQSQSQLQKEYTHPVTPPKAGTGTPPEAGTPPRRAEGTNQRAKGTNPRANGTNPRVVQANPRKLRNGFHDLDRPAAQGPPTIDGTAEPEQPTRLRRIADG